MRNQFIVKYKKRYIIYSLLFMTAFQTRLMLDSLLLLLNQSFVTANNQLAF